MGLMGRILGAGGAATSVGKAVGGVAEVFVGNRAAREAAESARFTTALGQYGAEFATVRASRFDAFMNGLNRLPRPLLVVGTLALFVYAMFAPAGFSVRMQGLALVPEPLWWLLGAIVSFYFGARELHYRRELALPPVAVAIPVASAPAERDGLGAPSGAAPFVAFAPRPATDFRLDLGPEIEPDPAPADAALAPAPRPAALAVAAPVPVAVAVAVRAADPQFNAAVEEWHRRSA